jgi:MraZ protein
MAEWERQMQNLRKNTNIYNREHNQFLQGFFKGIAEVVLDASNRLLIPKRLLDVIAADREIVMIGQMDKINLWSPDGYNQIDVSDDSLAALAEKILGNRNNDTGE